MADLGSGSNLNTSRRTLVRGAAWSVPVVAVAAAAPSYAASLCSLRSNPASTLSTTNGTPGFTRNSAISAVWRTSDPDGTAARYSSNTITIAVTKTSDDLLLGFQNNDSLNLTARTANTISGITLNQRAASATALRGPGRRSQTTFTFARPAYNLTFAIADITKSSTDNAQGVPQTVNFWDAVSVISTSSYTATKGADVTGTGSDADPFTARQGSGNADDNGGSNVALVFTSPVTSLTINYWSADKVANASDAGAGQGITVQNMTMQLRPTSCG